MFKKYFSRLSGLKFANKNYENRLLITKGCKIRQVDVQVPCSSTSNSKIMNLRCLCRPTIFKRGIGMAGDREMYLMVCIVCRLQTYIAPSQGFFVTVRRTGTFF